VRSSGPTPLSLRAPGWYPDPRDDAIGAERWWDGSAWGEATRSPEDLDRAPQPAAATPVSPPKRGRTGRLRLPFGLGRSAQ
jgi:hypothetical protein